MRYEAVTAVRYSLRLEREIMFRLTYRVSECPFPGSECWFLVETVELELGMQETSNLKIVA